MIIMQSAAIGSPRRALEHQMNANSGKTAIVTGASSGIGRASAEALARAGFTVFGTSRASGQRRPGRGNHAGLRRDRRRVGRIAGFDGAFADRPDRPPGQQCRCRPAWRRRGILGRAGSGPVRRQSVRRHAHDQCGVAVDAAARRRAHHQYRLDVWAWSLRRTQLTIRRPSTRSKAIRNRSITRFVPSIFASRSSSRHSSVPSSTRTGSSRIPC